MDEPIIQVTPAYLFAAGHGDRSAQSSLAIGFCDHAASIVDDHPALSAEYFMAAEILAELACVHCKPTDLAKLAAILSARSHYGDDPARCVDYRERAEELFNEVEATGDTQALGIIGFALNKLIYADPQDDRAALRLDRIVQTLPAGDAKQFRNAARSTQPLEVH